jgi:6-phosphofructokinase 1
MRIGLLTGGGDCPGLNAVIRAVVRRAAPSKSEVIGILEGWRGLVLGSTRRVGPESTPGMLRTGGTILRTSRTNPFRSNDTLAQLLTTWKALGLDGLIVVGGEDTLGVAARLHREYALPVVGVPKTIDNDISATDFTFGFDTAVAVATEAIDRLHTTAEAHNRVIVVEVMGRHAGWIAMHAGLAGGADFIAIPEKETTLGAIAQHVQDRAATGRTFSIVVVAEGARIADVSGGRSSRTDEFGHPQLGGIGYELARRLEEKTGFDTRVTVLGHVQRGGTPTAHDRVLATRYGVFACDLVHSGEFGKMVALAGARIVAVPLDEAVTEPKTVPAELFELAETFFG